MNNASQIRREVRWSLWLTFGYLMSWIGCAYFSPTGRGYLGFPIWFELACLYLPIFFVIFSIIVIKIVYKELNLDGE